MRQAVTYNNYYLNTGIECPEEAPATERKLILCDAEGENPCPCPTAPAVMYLSDVNRVIYVPEFIVDTYKVMTCTFTNNTGYPVKGFTILINGVYLLVNVPGTEILTQSGETVTYDIYIPRDLRERVIEETGDPNTDMSGLSVDFGVVFTQTVQPVNMPVLRQWAGGQSADYTRFCTMVNHEDEIYTIMRMSLEGNRSVQYLLDAMENEEYVGDMVVSIEPASAT